MTQLISYTLVRILELIVTEYFVYALAVTLIIGVIELIYFTLGIRRRRLE